MNNDSVAEPGRIQREHEVNMSLTTMSEMMFKGSMRKSEMRTEMIDKLNEVVDGLTECVKSANTTEELNAGLETKEIKRYFDENTKGPFLGTVGVKADMRYFDKTLKNRFQRDIW